MKNPNIEDDNANRDPISGTAGAHPVGTGLGAAAGGAATGAALGTTVGPLGTAAGMVAGAIVGGLIGKTVAEKIDPTEEDKYWRSKYAECPYVDRARPYEAYRPAYRTGYEGFETHAGKTFDEAEPDLQQHYYSNRDASELEWEHARPASLDAWQRVASKKNQTPNG